MPPQYSPFQRQLYELLLDSQYWPPERLVAYQQRQLATLLLHARAQVPFYEKRLDPVFRIDGSIDWSRWEELPIIKRQDLLDHRPAMQARRWPPAHGNSRLAESSGSTGQPIRITINDIFGITNMPFVWRGHRWQDVDWSQTIATRVDKSMNLDTMPDGRWAGPWGPAWLPESAGGRQVDMGYTTPPEMLLHFLARHKPAYLMTGSNTVHMLAIESRRLGIPLHFRATFGHAEAVRKEAAAATREIFGAPLYERYSSREAGQMAHECTHQHGLHVNAEKVLVEIVDENGHACPPGVSGRVVVTPFYNTAQPLIRYEQGDMAMFGEPCPCGRTLPVIGEVLGRMSAIFRHPSGASVHNFLPEPARVSLKCGLWQIAQTGPLDFEVRYVPNDWNVPGDEAAAAVIFRKAFFADANVKFVRMQRLRATPSDKYLEYVYEVKS